MNLTNSITILLLATGAFFFLAGAIGLLRFPDVFTRLHALTKVDNLGLGLIVAALSIQAESWTVVGKLVLIWLLVLFASSTTCHLIARAALHKNLLPWKSR
ncbi:monovalent cation/H(+) antiporter subunit G [Nitrosomonas mobilis]|uniref:Monovalent cation/proton antiporter, MnhG/PhaG subunit n=1 Tax=Nitrosomonas mobilis TaxID=51642 RepID=A0A1G5SGB4_9PROT|nr:monovalent cation/H(+) antiporter subunit G [Nitrosomonas mobilis]SCZ85429.1 Monovalent cation/proton antiporter, MnhG/PhaG subunit [Nitrosomonas mobilis]HNO74326.1 monovalent cation/H(+) antiporter subunit G [Nitrosomonas mobilis]